jgi:class 3 adenylate cyclase
MTATGFRCGSCGTELPLDSRFCNKCGAPITPAAASAEYKQVTVLFADVVRSMDIAATVGAERLREIMAELVNRCTKVVKRYGGAVDKFTGDGIMAVFGAPVALEDHAVRACLAALGVQEEAKRLAVEVRERDGVELQLRVGLNSGQVIAGEIGSGPFGYTAVGEQVGMAQRMESVAPPGGVMLSASTARLVDGAATLGESQLVQIKGVDVPLPARRLLGMGDGHRAVGRAESTLVGRRWEMSAVEGLLERAIDGDGAVVGVVGSPGIGKSRLVREIAAIAAVRSVDVFTAFCESHTCQVPFHVVARLLRAVIGVEGLDGQEARDRLRDRIPDADPEDVLLFDDLLGIGDSEADLPKIAPDARRRRLTALVNAASLARKTPAVYVVEDAHWIDEVSESMLADFLTVIPQTPSLVLITYRPEYRGPLTQLPGAQTVALAPLSNSETATLITELLGADPSVRALGQTVADRTAGNPFFAEEMVRDLAERGMLRGNRGTYVSTADSAEVSVPATLQATIAARIDRIDPAAKRTLSAASVIGSRFSRGVLETLGIDPVLQDLVAGKLIDQITFTRQPEYVFHHPLIRTVAYESQLKADRAQLHPRVAAAIESRDPAAAEENAALIAEHLEAAGDLRGAFGWHMRAGAWSTNRDIVAARTSWQRARHVADRLPADDPDRAAMRIAPRTLLSGSAWRVGGSGADTGFDELGGLCTAAGDQRSLAIGMTGQVMAEVTNAHRREASRLATEHIALLKSIGDPTLTVACAHAAMLAKNQTGEMAELLRLAQLVIDLTEGDPTKGNLILGSPLAQAFAFRATARWNSGIARWRDDLHQAIAMARAFDPTTLALVTYFAYISAIPNGVLRPDAIALQDTAQAVALAEQFGDEIALSLARTVRGVTLAHRDGPEREAGLDLLTKMREMALNERFSLVVVPMVDIHLAQERTRLGDLDGAIRVSRAVVDDLLASGGAIWNALAADVLVEAVLRRGCDADFPEAQAAIERLAAVPTDPGFVLNEIWLLRLRALLASAHGDEAAYRDYRDRYRDMAKTLGYEGHIAWAEAMP